ncbi:hypothetical protein C8F04DRAFT_1190467 [Mycena alexandri]|uniref:Uncharacterized protein n=1 Tax=Mycena alexandri TaxID=1745969 RepID=A0AAD6SEK3_9AGAR|nr:hypothetical protein C8F04DRAFT_1190467 [Mycena alexandri]
MPSISVRHGFLRGGRGGLLGGMSMRFVKDSRGSQRGQDSAGAAGPYVRASELWGGGCRAVWGASKGGWVDVAREAETPKRRAGRPDVEAAAGNGGPGFWGNSRWGWRGWGSWGAGAALDVGRRRRRCREYASDAVIATDPGGKGRAETAALVEHFEFFSETIGEKSLEGYSNFPSKNQLKNFKLLCGLFELHEKFIKFSRDLHKIRKTHQKKRGDPLIVATKLYMGEIKLKSGDEGP